MRKHTFKVARNKAERKSGKFYTVSLKVGDNPKDWGHLGMGEGDVNDQCIDGVTIAVQGGLRRNWPASEALAQKWVDDWRPGRRVSRAVVAEASKFDATQRAYLASIGVKFDAPAAPKAKATAKKSAAKIKTA